jgi:hypothetical protein
MKKAEFYTHQTSGKDGKAIAAAVKGYVADMDNVGFYREEAGYMHIFKPVWYAIDLPTGAAFGEAYTVAECAKIPLDDLHGYRKAEGYEKMVSEFESLVAEAQNEKEA